VEGGAFSRPEHGRRTRAGQDANNVGPPALQKNGQHQGEKVCGVKASLKKKIKKQCRGKGVACLPDRNQSGRRSKTLGSHWGETAIRPGTNGEQRKGLQQKGITFQKAGRRKGIRKTKLE